MNVSESDSGLWRHGSATCGIEPAHKESLKTVDIRPSTGDGAVKLALRIACVVEWIQMSAKLQVHHPVSTTCSSRPYKTDIPYEVRYQEGEETNTECVL